MRKNSIWLLCAAALLAFLIAVVPGGTISAKRCVDAYGRPTECPKKRPTPVYPSFTPTVTLTSLPTATKVLTSTPTKVPSATDTPSAIPALTEEAKPAGGLLLWGGGLLGLTLVVAIVWLFGGGGEESSTFDAKAHGDLNADGGDETMELSEKINSDDSTEGSDGMYEDKEDE
jgi:hypothetical protein